MKKCKLDKGMRHTGSGTIECFGNIYNKRGDSLRYSFTRETKDEILDIKAKLRLLGNVDNDVVKIKINKHTNEIELIRTGQATRNRVATLNKGMLVKDYVQYFLFTHRRKGVRGKQVEDTTFSGYIDKCKYIEEYLGDKKLAELILDDVEEFIGELHERTCDTTTRQTRDLLVSMLKFAKKDGVIEYNILQGEDVNLKESKGKTKKEIIKEEDIATFRKHCEEHKHYEMLMLLYTGMRASEMAGLTWKDLDMERCTIDINKEYMRIKKVELVNGKRVAKYVKDFKDLKSKSSYRVIGLDSKYVELLKQHKEEQKELAKKNGKTFSEEDWIFTTVTYNGYLSDYTSDKMRKIMNTLKIKNYKVLTPHCLRHTYCSNGIRGGTDLKQMQLILGHSNIGITRRLVRTVR